jgi:hypothetical protein
MNQRINIMDFSTFDGPTLAEKGGRLHLLDYVTGKPIGAGDKASIVRVKGAEAASFRSALKALEAAKMSEDKDKDKDKDKENIDDIHDELVLRVKSLIIGFENISNGKAALTASEADIAWFLNLQKLGVMAKGKAPTFVEQVLEFARDRSNLLGNA